LLAKLGVLDFAGGTVIHINAGITALVLSMFLGPRRHPQTHPYNRPWVLLGTAILWIGWYGFNAGSALAANNQAITAALTTSVGAASAMCGWMVLDVWRKGKPTLLGTCTGALCGLVGITPATGYVTVAGATAIGLLATAASYAFVTFAKPRLRLDDALDAFGCHGISGIVGSILTGFFASKSVNPAIAEGGILGGGSWHLVWVQLVGTVITIVLVAVMVVLITAGLRLLLPMRVSAAAEKVGLDISEHGETADHSVHEGSDVLEYPEEFVGQLGGFRIGHRQTPD
jgi:Amt family ammonium transporter